MTRPYHRLLATALLLLASLPSARAEQSAPGLIMPGTRYETAYWRKTGPEPGPSVVIIGGCHGDEPAGYLAAGKLLRWTVRSGTLWVLPEAHKEAIRHNARAYPGNMNAMFPGQADGTDMQRLAYWIWQMIKAAKPSLLVTLHESLGYHAEDPSRFGQTFTYDFRDETPFAQSVLARANPDIGPTLHKFLPFVAPYESCPTYNARKWLGIPAITVETCRKLDLETRVKYQLMAIEAFLGTARLEEVVGKLIEQGGRLHLSLPHPSGASRWLNETAHKESLERALQCLREVNGELSNAGDR